MMMSRTLPGGKNASSGFTLVELLLVMTILALITSVALPRLNGTARRTRLEEGAEILAGFIRFARTESVRRGLKVRLEFGESGREYWLRIQDPESALRGHFVPFGDSLLDSRQALPYQVRVKAISGGRGDVRFPPVDFFPNSASSANELRLVDGSDRVAKIELGSSYDDVKAELVMDESSF